MSESHAGDIDQPYHASDRFHRAHCNQGDVRGCKYGYDSDCPVMRDDKAVSDEVKWAKESWEVHAASPKHAPHIVSAGKTFPTTIAICYESTSGDCGANAKRIVECVNFLRAHPSLTNAVVLSGEDVAELRMHLTVIRNSASDMGEVFMANRALALLPPAKAMP